MKKIAPIILLLFAVVSCKPVAFTYHYTEGQIFGTSYHITYEYPVNKSLDRGIVAVMNKFNGSLSNYDPESVISRFNTNDQKVKADDYFTTCFNCAQEISRKTNGAFDITVAPLVNIWGFGFKHKDSVYPERMDSLLQLTGFEKVKLMDGKLVKENPGIMLDVSAIAKGYGVDVVSEFLESKGISNYLVEIGGELRCKGLKKDGSKWRVGVDKPIESMLTREIEAVLLLSDISMATSGNYRQFYVENGVKYSHTINPATGYPVRHSLLSATVLAKDCMTADAYATAFMVMGLDKAKKLLADQTELGALLIYSDSTGEMRIWSSESLSGSLEMD